MCLQVSSSGDKQKERSSSLAQRRELVQYQLLVLWILVVVVGQRAHFCNKLQQNSRRTLLKPLVHALVPKSDAGQLLESADLFRHRPPERALSDGQPATSSTGTGWSTSNFLLQNFKFAKPRFVVTASTAENNIHPSGFATVFSSVVLLVDAAVSPHPGAPEMRVMTRL